MNESRMMNTIITTLPTEIIYFPYFEFINNLSDEEIQQVKNNVNHLASNSQILETYIENLCWGDFKSKISNQIVLKSNINKKLKGENANVFRSDFGEKNILSNSKMNDNLLMLSKLTGIRSDILERKKKNLEERKKLKKMKRLRLPKLKSSKNFIEINKSTYGLRKSKGYLGSSKNLNKEKPYLSYRGLD